MELGALVRVCLLLSLYQMANVRCDFITEVEWPLKMYIGSKKTKKMYVQYVAFVCICWVGEKN